MHLSHNDCMHNAYMQHARAMHVCKMHAFAHFYSESILHKCKKYIFGAAYILHICPVFHILHIAMQIVIVIVAYMQNIPNNMRKM